MPLALNSTRPYKSVLPQIFGKCIYEVEYKRCTFCDNEHKYGPVRLLFQLKYVRACFRLKVYHSSQV